MRIESIKRGQFSCLNGNIDEILVNCIGFFEFCRPCERSSVEIFGKYEFFDLVRSVGVPLARF